MGMIEIAHLATGALVGREFDGPLQALLAGVAMHGLMDIAPHGEINDRSFEIATTVVGLLALAARYGWRSPITLGALGGVLPDGEHVLPARIKPQTALFPTHRISWMHASDVPLGIPAWAQVVVGGAVLGGFLFGRGSRRRRRAA